MLESLIQYLRAALPRMREDTTTVGRELDMAKAFLDIHRMRMGSRLDYVVEVPEALRCRPFPPMMLITLVENAVIHGVDPCCEAGTITIRASEQDGKLRFSVADTGQGISPKKGTGVGLVNIRERLKALYGGAARLVIEENVPRGVVATIEVDVPATSAVPAPVAVPAAKAA
jgi:LytS/YehU family sensor histidine kinase